MSLREKLDLNRIPKHIAVIMDGNGRWAKKQGFLRAIGHENGVTSLRRTSEAAVNIGVKYLTVYAFSSENWNRPKLEVNAIMSLMVSSLKRELQFLQDNDTRLESIGNIENLPKKCRRELTEVMEKTKNNKSMVLTVALSYGSREELMEGVKKTAQKVLDEGLDPSKLTEKDFEDQLYTKDMPDPDLLIRTSGEQRISNYLLWQIAYSELYFSDKLWPDFQEEDLYHAIYDYQNRERRFGKISEQLNS
jgi:undecaprenyl diphosphate synthase